MSAAELVPAVMNLAMGKIQRGEIVDAVWLSDEMERQHGANGEDAALAVETVLDAFKPAQESLQPKEAP